MFNYPRYSKEDYEKNKTILYHRQLDGSEVRVVIPGGGVTVSEMLEHFRCFLAACTYNVDGEFIFNSRAELEEEERERKERRDREDQYESAMARDGLIFERNSI
jgi:hypothetical protein